MLLNSPSVDDRAITEYLYKITQRKNIKLIRGKQGFKLGKL